MSLSRLAAIADAITTDSGALRVVGASARATELDIETSRVLVSLNCYLSAGLHTQARCDFRLGGRAIRRLIVAAKDRLNLITDKPGDETLVFSEKARAHAEPACELRNYVEDERRLRSAERARSESASRDSA